MADHDLEARRGWDSDFQEFSETPSRLVRIRLEDFLGEVSGSQRKACSWMLSCWHGAPT